MKSPEERNQPRPDLWQEITMNSSKEKIFSALEALREQQIEDALHEREYHSKRDALLYEQFFIQETKLINPNKAQKRARNVLSSLYNNDGKYGKTRPESKINVYMQVYHSHVLNSEDTNILVRHWEDELSQIKDDFSQVRQTNLFAFFTYPKEKYKQYFSKIVQMYYQLLPPFEDADAFLDSNKIGIFMGCVSEAKRLGIEGTAFGIKDYFKSLYLRGITQQMSPEKAVALFAELDVILPGSSQEQMKKMLDSSYTKANDSFVRLMTTISPELADLNLEDAQKIEAFRQIANDWGFLNNTMGQLTKLLFRDWIKTLQEQHIIKKAHMPKEKEIDDFQESIERFELFAEKAVEKYLEQDTPEKAYQLFIKTVTSGTTQEIMSSLIKYALSKSNRHLLHRVIQEVQVRFSEEERKKMIRDTYRSYLITMAYSENFDNLQLSPEMKEVLEDTTSRIIFIQAALKQPLNSELYQYGVKILEEEYSKVKLPKQKNEREMQIIELLGLLLQLKTKNNSSDNPPKV